MKSALIALVAAAGALAGCADENAPQAAAAGGAATPTADVAAAPTGRESCFFTRDIVNHTIVDASTLLLRTRSNAIFRVDMSGACLAGRSSDDPLIFRQRPGGQTICRAVDLDISIGRGGMPPSIGPGAFRTPCIARTLTRLTPAEVAALPRGQRP